MEEILQANIIIDTTFNTYGVCDIAKCQNVNGSKSVNPFQQAYTPLILSFTQIS